ncbi:MAG: hypothetical protein A2X30_11875 [Elusimicrobia bacterium GWB2_63_16]|nr:MAG: hypothetical protein A2X30_11875 [Elusimicrobia bacterium GWB2_63_16]
MYPYIVKILSLAAVMAALLLAGCSGPGKRLLSDDALVRSAALESAAASAPKDKVRIVARLRKALAGRDPRRRAYAVTALEDIGAEAVRAAPELMAALGDGDPFISAAAERALVKLKGTAPALAGALLSTDPVLKLKAPEILAAQGEAGVLALAANFERGSRELALESCLALGRLGPAAEKGVPALARAASSTDPAVKAAALGALSNIGRPAGLWLAAALKSASPRSRAGAAALLAAMPSPPAETLEPLASALEDPDGAVRENAGTALAAFTPELMNNLPSNLLPVLSKAAAAGSKESGPTLLALVRTGRAEGKWLAAALRSPEPRTREAAGLALLLMFPPPQEAAEPLLETLKDADLKVRRSAAAALGNYAVASPATLPAGTVAALLAATSDADPETRNLAVFPLGRLAPADRSALDAVIQTLASADPEVRVSAAAALTAAGKKAAAAETALWKVFRSRDCRQKTAAAKALAAVKPELRRLPAVARALKTICPALKTAPPAPSALPGLAPKKKKKPAAKIPPRSAP